MALGGKDVIFRSNKNTITMEEIKIKVAQLMGEIENKWKDTYKGEGEVTKEKSEEYGKFAEEKE